MQAHIVVFSTNSGVERYFKSTECPTADHEVTLSSISFTVWMTLAYSRTNPLATYINQDVPASFLVVQRFT